MPFFSDDKFENKYPNNGTEWTDQDADLAWKQFMRGCDISDIAREIGRTKKSVKRQIQNQVDYFDRHPATMSHNRDSFKVTGREQWVIKRGREIGLAEDKIAVLIGRFSDQVLDRRTEWIRSLKG